MTSRYSAPTSDTLFQQAVVDQDQPWIQASACSLLLQDLSRADISTQAGRQVALGRLTSVLGGAPYMIEDGSALHSVALRFGTSTNAGVVNPAVCWVALFCDGWDVLFTQVSQAVGFRNRAEQKSLLTNSALLEVEQTKSTPDPSQCRSEYNDAFVSYHKAIQAMRQLLRNRTGVFNYKTFEIKYALVWSTAAPTILGPTHASLNSMERLLGSIHPQRKLTKAELQSLLDAGDYDDSRPT